MQRDFQAQAEGLDAEKEFGEHGLRICDELFWSWEIYQHTGDRRELQRRIQALRRELKPILRQYAGKKPRYRRTHGLARNLLKLWPALWTFTSVKGVTPTNNHAERSLRGAVIYRKLSPRQPVRQRRDPDRPPALGADHLPLASPQPVRLSRRRAHPPRPRRARCPTGLTHGRRGSADQLKRLHNVCTTQADQQRAMDGPGADSADLGELGDDLLVRELGQASFGQTPVGEVRGQLQGGVGLAP